MNERNLYLADFWGREWNMTFPELVHLLGFEAFDTSFWVKIRQVFYLQEYEFIQSVKWKSISYSQIL